MFNNSVKCIAAHIQIVFSASNIRILLKKKKKKVMQNTSFHLSPLRQAKLIIYTLISFENFTNNEQKVDK